MSRNSPRRAAPDLSRSWRVAAVSQQGLQHERAGLPCQDALGWRVTREGILVAAAADGAGSAVAAEMGAWAAVESALTSLEENAAVILTSSGTMRRAALTLALEDALEAIYLEAHAASIAPEQLASTLILVVADSAGIAAAQVGDGASVFRGCDGSITGLTAPPATEYLNETQFLTSEGAIASAQLRAISVAVKEIALLTDGLQMVALQMPDGTPHSPFFGPLFDAISSDVNPAVCRDRLAGFLASPRLLDKVDDDRSLLLAALT